MLSGLRPTLNSMSKKVTRDRVEDAAFLSRLIRAVREQPKRFRAGAALLESMFATAVLRRKYAATARDIRKAYTRESPIRESERAIVRDLRASMSDPASAKREALREAERWVREQPDMMERSEAEAVCLVVALMFDDNPRPCRALPKCLHGIPWGGVREPFVLIPGRFFRADALGHNPDLLERARIAWARIEAWGGADADGPTRPTDELHEGHRLAVLALAELDRLAPETKGQQQKVRYRKLTELHEAGTLETYQQAGLPGSVSFWKYVRDFKAAHAKERSDLAP